MMSACKNVFNVEHQIAITHLNTVMMKLLADDDFVRVVVLILLDQSHLGGKLMFRPITHYLQIPQSRQKNS